MLVKDMMTPDPITISPQKPVLEALLMMYQYDIRRLPVIENDRLVGILSDRDIKQLMGRPSLSIKERDEAELDLVVGQVMIHDVITVRPDVDLREAIELMVERKFSGLPVVDRDQKLVGVLSAIDVLRYTMDLLDQVEGK